MKNIVYERYYKPKDDDYKKIASMLKKYDIIGYLLTVIYSISLLVFAFFSYLHIGLEIDGLRIFFFIQGLVGLYFLYNWTSGYKTSARAILTLFVKGNESIRTKFYEECVKIIYNDGNTKVLKYDSLKNIRRGEDFFLMSFGIDYVFVNYDSDNEEEQKFIMFMGQLENNYCKNKVDKLALRTLVGMIIIGVIIMTEIILLMMY